MDCARARHRLHQGRGHPRCRPSSRHRSTFDRGLGLRGDRPHVAGCAHTLGAGPGRVVRASRLPALRSAVSAPAPRSAFARGIGEFGATIMFAGSLQGRHADAVARDLRAVRSRLRDRARDQRRARPYQRPSFFSVKLLTGDGDLNLYSHPSPSVLRSRAEPSSVEWRLVALVGPSGAGKTSVLRVVSGLLRPQRGCVRLGEETWLDTERGIDLPPDRAVGRSTCSRSTPSFPHLDVRRERGVWRRSDGRSWTSYSSASG